MQFAQKIPKEQNVSQLATQLTWSHIIEVLPVKAPLAVEFYLTMSSSGRWGRNRLRKEIDSMLFERTAIATKPDELIKKELADLAVYEGEKIITELSDEEIYEIFTLSA